MATLTTSYQLIASKYIGAVSGSGVNAKNIYLRIYAKYTSQSIVDNKSYVSYKSTLYVDGEGTYFYTGNTTTKTLSGTGATSVSADAQGNYNLGETTLCETTGTITHGSTGVASVSITAGWTSTPWGISGSLTGTADLPTIARATTPTLSATTITMGSAVNITLTPANSTFKHKLRYDFGSVAGTADGFSIGAEFTAQGNTTVTFTPPTSLGSQIPNNLSGTGQIVCYTYTSSGTHIGTTYVKITLNVPSYTPTITSITLTGNNLLSSAYVQGKSTVTVNANVATQYGAKITSITTNIDDKDYTELPFTTGVLSSGSKTAKITIKDSRGKSVTVESSAIQVYAYALPNITEFTLTRQADGTTVIATVKGSISAINNKNSKTIKVTLNGVTNTITSSAYTINAYTINATTTFTGVPTDTTLTGKAVFTDSYVSIERAATLPTVAVTMDFYKDGNGIAMGKVAEQGNLLDVAWDAKFGGEINTGNPSKTMSNISYRGQNPITKASEDTLDFWAAQGNLATAFFTNGTVDMNKPSTWGYLLHIASTPGTKEFHQLWLEQSNGSVYHRGANASAINSWRMMLDTTNCPDYVIEQGTVDGWEYTKWKNGKMELFSAKSLSFPEGTKQTDYLYRSIVSLDLSKYFTKIMSGTCSIQTNGMVPQVCRHSTNLATAEIVIVTSRTIPAFTITAPLYIIGKWK